MDYYRCREHWIIQADQPTPAYSAQKHINSPPPQPNRVLIHKPTGIQITIPEEVVMQLSFKVAIMVLQVEGWVSSSGYVGFTLRFTATIIIPKPNQIAFSINHLSWNVDFGRSGSSGFVGCFLRLR